MGFCKRMEKIAWTEFLRKYEVLNGVEENRNIIYKNEGRLIGEVKYCVRPAL